MTTTKQLQIFVVEDEAMIMLDLEDILRDLGHEVLGTAANPQTALDLLDGLVAAPDVAIVDANLGGSSARPVVDALESHGIPVVLTSGYGASELKRLGLDHPIVRKPYSSRDIDSRSG